MRQLLFFAAAAQPRARKPDDHKCGVIRSMDPSPILRYDITPSLTLFHTGPTDECVKQYHPRSFSREIFRFSASPADTIGCCVGFKTVLIPLTVEISAKSSYIGLYEQITKQDPDVRPGRYPDPEKRDN